MAFLKANAIFDAFPMRVGCVRARWRWMCCDKLFFYLQDDVISQHWIFRLLQYITCLYSRIVYNFSVSGWHKLPKDGPALLVSTHTTHSTDILICCLTAHKLSGRVVRGLLHRLLVTFMPWLRYLGLVSGHRDSAIQLLRKGHWVAVVPGGAEEIAYHIGDHGSNGNYTSSFSFASLEMIQDVIF